MLKWQAIQKKIFRKVTRRRETKEIEIKIFFSSVLEQFMFSSIIEHT